LLPQHVHEYFDLRPAEESPYMLLVAPVREDKRLEDAAADLRGLAKLHQPRSVIPAVTHVDYSARVQTVDDERHPRFAALLRAFQRQTGCPVLVNTSFNVRGEPIVNSPEDAYRCFLATNMDVLVLENLVLERAKQQPAKTIDRDAYLGQFALD
jgi:carbamoyltransferase